MQGEPIILVGKKLIMYSQMLSAGWGPGHLEGIQIFIDIVLCSLALVRQYRMKDETLSL